MPGKVRTVEQIIAGLARPRHGVVTRALLLAAGVTADQIDARIASGTLIVVHRGVYRVGHAAPLAEATYLAAVLACGDGALLGGLAACWLHRLVSDGAPAPTVWSPRERRVPGIVCRRARREPLPSTRVARIPVVSVSRALVDAAAVLPAGELVGVCHEAGVKHRTTPRQVARVMPANAPGARRLRAVLTGEQQVTLSRLETAFRELMRDHGLPPAVTNKVASGRRVDCRWPDRRVTVELDSFTFHNTRQAWERDRRREREAYARGDQFRRYTWADVFEDPTLMLAELRGLLS